jgi:acyl-CoA hydrolase
MEKDPFDISQFRLVYPSDLNPHGNLFGGRALEWMDEVAFITASRATRQKMVTYTCEKIRFLRSIPKNSLIEIRGRITKVRPVSVEIEVILLSEDIVAGQQEKAIEGRFILVSINEQGQPVRINTTFGPLKPGA